MTSKRELERRLADLEDDALPTASLIELLSLDFEVVDTERRLVRIEGELREVPESAAEKLKGLADDADSTDEPDTSD